MYTSTAGCGALLSLLGAVLLAGPVSVAAAPRVDAVALFDGGAMLEIDGVRHLLRVGDASPEGCRLLVATSRGGTIDCNGVRSELALSVRVGGSYSTVAAASVRLTADKAGQYWARGTIDGQLVDLLVDTGASVVAMSSRSADRLGIVAPDDAEAGFVLTAQGKAWARMVTVGRIEVSGIVVPNVRVAVLDGDYPLQILLGMSFLRHVILQNQGGVLVLTAQ